MNEEKSKVVYGVYNVRLFREEICSRVETALYDAA